MLAGCALLASTGRSLDALALGELQAASLGVDLSRLRLRVIAGTALAVGAATSAFSRRRIDSLSSFDRLTTISPSAEKLKPPSSFIIKATTPIAATVSAAAMATTTFSTTLFFIPLSFPFFSFSRASAGAVLSPSAPSSAAPFSFPLPSSSCWRSFIF
jgi:ABC-type cobalamin transport system permease subunit